MWVLHLNNILKEMMDAAFSQEYPGSGWDCCSSHSRRLWEVQTVPKVQWNTQVTSKTIILYKRAE